MWHCLEVQQFDRKFLERLARLADTVRALHRTRNGALWLSGLLSHRGAMLYFVQPSTRTYLSFLSACQVLGLKTADVRDPRTSSEVKGESELDTVRTFSMYYDAVIMRHPAAGFAREVAAMLGGSKRPVPVINAGSGKDQHPTQALLDVYTLQRSLAPVGGLDGKRVAFVGDLLRGRTVRSLAMLLTNFTGVQQYFVAPPDLQIGDDILEYLVQRGSRYYLTSKLDQVLPRVDAVYMTRLQDEWDEPGSVKTGYRVQDFAINAGNIAKLASHAAILHPLPRRHELAPEIDDDPRAVYWDQVRDGMWIRVALLAHIMGVENQIALHDR